MNRRTSRHWPLSFICPTFVCISFYGFWTLSFFVTKPSIHCWRVSFSQSIWQSFFSISDQSVSLVIRIPCCCSGSMVKLVSLTHSCWVLMGFQPYRYPALLASAKSCQNNVQLTAQRKRKCWVLGKEDAKGIERRRAKRRYGLNRI